MTHATEWGLMGTSVVIAFLGISLAVSFYSGAYPFRMPERVASSLGGFYRLVRDKYRVDELYEAVFVNGLIKKGGRLMWDIDARVLDLIPNGASGLTIGLSKVSSWFDRDVRGRRGERSREHARDGVARDAPRAVRAHAELRADHGGRRFRIRLSLSPPEMKKGAE